jgi:hypothetical protein
LRSNTAEELLADVMTGYFEELERTRETLDRRYDDIKSGRVKLVSGETLLRGYGNEVPHIAIVSHEGWL